MVSSGDLDENYTTDLSGIFSVASIGENLRNLDSEV